MSFPLSSTWGFFRRGVISSTEVAREAVLEGSMTEAGEVTETPFSTTRTVVFPMLERGSFFLLLIFAYIPWLNLVYLEREGTQVVANHVDLVAMEAFLISWLPIRTRTTL